MGGVKDQKQLEELRKRLYARNFSGAKSERHQLKKDSDAHVPQSWGAARTGTQVAGHGDREDSRRDMVRRDINASYDQSNGAVETAPTADQVPEAASSSASGGRRYRKRILLSALGVFIIGLVFSSLYLLFGLNEISGRNIVITANAPLSLGAGEVVPLSFSIRNQNAVPVVSGTLVVNYPVGSRSAEDSSQSLTTTRIPIERIESGEAIEVPAEAIIFGETDEEKTIDARFEYRVEDTNSTLEKAVDPLVFRITSSPLVIEVESLEKVAAGQEFTTTLTVRSNAPTTLNTVLVSAQYPSGFDFTESNPEPVFGNDSWQIDEIGPGEEKEIQITGLLLGEESQEFVMDVEVGIPRTDNRFILDSIYATDRHDFILEQPFIGIITTINGKQGESVVLSSARNTTVSIDLTNTLDTPVYDTRLVARLSGTALDPREIQVNDGFYDSNDNTVRFDVTTEDSLERIAPGDSRRFTFTIEPRHVPTGSVDIAIDSFARRALEASSQEQLLGSSQVAVQYESILELGSSADIRQGSVPPEEGRRSEYEISLRASAGENDIVDGQVTTSLPTYVEWLDNYTGSGEVSYNQVNKTITWTVGSLSARDASELTFAVAIQPSASQVGQTPVLVNTQQFRATDRYTGTVVRGESAVISTELSSDLGYDRGNGEVED